MYKYKAEHFSLCDGGKNGKTCLLKNLKCVSLKTLTKSKDCSLSRIKFLFHFHLFHVEFLQCTFMAGFRNNFSEFSESQAAFGTTFRATGGFRKAGFCWNKPPEEGYRRIFTISK
jgi:hypothetical protein